MAIAPEPILRAYLDLIREVSLYVRAKSFGADRLPDDQLHDLMDAIHNIPELLTEFGGFFTSESMREVYLEPYDKRWATVDGLSLCRTLDESLNGSGFSKEGRHDEE